MKFIAPEDIHVYSIDEVFIDVTDYLHTCNLTARELTMKMILDVLETTGVTASAVIGTNLYLAKIAMDIRAKHIAMDKNGVQIAELDEYMKDALSDKLQLIADRIVLMTDGATIPIDEILSIDGEIFKAMCDG